MYQSTLFRASLLDGINLHNTPPALHLRFSIVPQGGAFHLLTHPINLDMEFIVPSVVPPPGGKSGHTIAYLLLLPPSYMPSQGRTEKRKDRRNKRVKKK